jgi:RNA polymerase sigma-70 factor (ECF subfamily)
MSRESDFKQNIEALLLQAATGDERAWRELVEAYSGRVFGLIRAQCADAELAEEITQSTFCTIAAKIESYTEVGRFEPWIFRIAMNRLRDEMRRRKRQARPVGEEALVGLAGTTDEPRPEQTFDEEHLRDLRQAMSRLSASDQRIIHLRHYAGLSFRQIAEVLDQPLGTVLARQHRALKKLRELMGSQIDEEEPK